MEDIGTKLLIHNQYNEILTVIDDKTAYEWLLIACIGKVYSQAVASIEEMIYLNNDYCKVL